MIDKSEMCQSIMTGLAMLAAEELECDWRNIRTEFAPNDKVYFNPIVGFQGTGDSSSTHTADSSRCPPEGGRYMNQLQVHSHRRAEKKDCSSAIASSARIPEVTVTR
jgi:CO/xanthine dehydrogenase Mo-binding subunit